MTLQELTDSKVIKAPNRIKEWSIVPRNHPRKAIFYMGIFITLIKQNYSNTYIGESLGISLNRVILFKTKYLEALIIESKIEVFEPECESDLLPDGAYGRSFTDFYQVSHV